MVTTGIDFAANLVPELKWSDLYQTNTYDREIDGINPDHQLLSSTEVPIPQEDTDGDGFCDFDNSPTTTGACPDYNVVVQTNLVRVGVEHGVVAQADQGQNHPLLLHELAP